MHGQTAFKRQRGKDYVGEAACFGEAICCRIPLRIQTKMEPRWEADGVYLGKLDLSDEVIVGRPTGIETTRSFRRMTEDGQWNPETLRTFVGVPWNPRGITTDAPGGIRKHHISRALVQFFLSFFRSFLFFFSSFFFFCLFSFFFFSIFFLIFLFLLFFVSSSSPFFYFLFSFIIIFSCVFFFFCSFFFSSFSFPVPFYFFFTFFFISLLRQRHLKMWWRHKLRRSGVLRIDHECIESSGLSGNGC